MHLASQLARSFPSQEQVARQTKAGMSSKQIAQLFGAPTARRGEDQDDVATMTYVAPLSTLNSPEEGYSGFEILFREGKVIEWVPIRGAPSYSPSPTRE